MYWSGISGSWYSIVVKTCIERNKACRSSVRIRRVKFQPHFQAVFEVVEASDSAA